MNANRRMTSIAMRVNFSILCRLLLTTLFIDLLALTLALGAWCYTAERQAFGESWTPWIRRNVEWTGTGTLRETLSTVVYVPSVDGGRTVRVAAGGYLNLLLNLLITASALEAVFLSLQFALDRKKTRRLLEPLSRMAEATHRMINERLDGQKYHELQAAISQISPGSPDARLSTGDRELQGLEEAINSLLGRMHESYRQQTRFVSDASHEFRTPISVIRGYAGMLNRWGKDDPKVLDEGIEAIRLETDHMQRLVEQLLFLARGDAGKNHLSLAALDLTAMMREVFEEYDMLDSSHRWRFQAASPVPALGDLAMLKQTARILCDNAQKYSPENSPVTLRCSLDVRGVPCFSVQDNGVGIAQKDLPQIFDRFFRADPARARQSGGTGLGLSIAHWIVDSHGGYFEVYSHEGIGTRVTVCLPQGESPKDGKPAASVHPVRAAASGK